jgi:hypothetical protein
MPILQRTPLNTAPSCTRPIVISIGFRGSEWRTHWATDMKLILYFAATFQRMFCLNKRRPVKVNNRPLGLRPGLNYESYAELLEQVEGSFHR